VVELFAGVGGFRLGLEAHGFRTVWANQWEPSTRKQHAFDCYVARFGDSPAHVNDDLERVMDEAEAGRTEIPDHELLVGGFPCFVAGTMVLTEHGHRPIEQVAVGDRVLTHLGRWRSVTGVMSREAPETLVVRGHGLPDVRTTPEHPFWARRRDYTWAGPRSLDRWTDEPRWMEAQLFDRDTLVCQVLPTDGPSVDEARAALGASDEGAWSAETDDRGRALDLALLAQRAFGVVPNVSERATAGGPSRYRVGLPGGDRLAFVEGAYGWRTVRSIGTGPPATVHNLSVDEDESYVADGCVVHNCQDYSVARTLNQALGIEGKKGVLWWQIHRLLTMKRPPVLVLENVDRLLKSPAGQRGRDFAVMLVTLANLGYEVEWRVVNAADYGFPQKRRRVYLVGRLAGPEPRDATEVLHRGVLGRALPVAVGPLGQLFESFSLLGDPVEVSERFGARRGQTPFRSAGYMSHRKVWTMDLAPDWDGPRTTLGDVLEPEADIPEAYFVPDQQLAAWRHLKGAKREQRVHKASGTPYEYVEGAIPFPDPTDGPSRTILTAEGGATPSRFKHLVLTDSGRYRRLTPRELERLNGFPDDWTDTGMPEGRRAFMMGNALVVGVVERIAAALAEDLRRDR
jgi:DNA (cytosine-5)-methyltransferase 1